MGPANCTSLGSWLFICLPAAGRSHQPAGCEALGQPSVSFPTRTRQGTYLLYSPSGAGLSVHNEGSRSLFSLPHPRCYFLLPRHWLIYLFHFNANFSTSFYTSHIIQSISSFLIWQHPSVKVQSYLTRDIFLAPKNSPEGIIQNTIVFARFYKCFRMWSIYFLSAKIEKWNFLLESQQLANHPCNSNSIPILSILYLAR